MPRSTDKKFDDYKNQYAKENYDLVKVLVPKGFRDTIREHASARGESNNAFINRAIREQMKRDQDAASNAPNT